MTWDGFVSLGMMYTIGEMQRTGQFPEDPVPPLQEPPSGHPERLRPDIPLTSLERALQRELESTRKST